MTTLHDMFVEPTAHHLCDSGSIYGRAYEANQNRNLEQEPQAKLTTKYGYPKVSVSTYQHLKACLMQDDICRAFDAHDDGSKWNSDYYGTTQAQQEFLENLNAEISEAWNTSNWENNFDQVLQGYNVTINEEQYILLQVHGGCDVRSGYTGARLFKVRDWMWDYLLLSDCEFWFPGHLANLDTEEVVVRFSDPGQIEIYDDNGDVIDVPEDFWEKLPELNLEGIQYAVQH